MKREQRQVSTQRFPIFWLALAALQLQDVCPKAIVNRGHDHMSLPPRIADTTSKLQSVKKPGILPLLHSATVAKSSRSPGRNSTQLKPAETSLARVAYHVPRPGKNAQPSGQHESIFQIHPGRTRMNELMNATKHLRRQQTSGKHDSTFQVGHTIAKTNSSKLQLANTSLTGHHRVAVKQAFAKLASEVHSVHSKTAAHSIQHPHSQVLIQRGTSHLRGLKFLSRHEPRNVEEVPLIWGVPKMVWVILADVLAMGVFLGCTVLAAWADRAVQEKGWQSGSISTPYQPDPLLLPQGRSPELTPQISAHPSVNLTPSFTHLKNGRAASPQFQV